MIYLDNAATTLHKPKCVADAVYEALQNLGNASRGGHGAALDSMRVIHDAREKISNLFGVGNPERVAFTMNATESLNLAIFGALNPGDHVITTACEHNSVLRPLYLMVERGLELTIVEADPLGNYSLESIMAAQKPNTRALVCTHASNVTGNVFDLTSIGSWCQQNELLLIVDASQTAGLLPIHMKEMNLSILCFTGHKGLLGPQGTGGICLAEGISLRPLKVGGSGYHSYAKTHPNTMPGALEAGTQNVHGIAGLASALTYIQEVGQDILFQKEQALADYFYQEVKKIPNVKLYGDFCGIRAPIVALNIGTYDSSSVSDELMERFGIATRPGAHCAPLMHEALGTVEQGIVRFSFSHGNTLEEVKTAVEAVRILATE